MTANIICLTSLGGIPLFSRQKGESNTISFSKMASLNGIHMFLKSQGIKLLTTDLPDTTVVWKEFEHSIILIVIASGATKSVLNEFLDAVFGVMTLFVGIDEIKNTKNIERLKKDTRLCAPVIDSLLDCLYTGDKAFTRTDIINMTECIITQENQLLQTCLEGYMECLDSMYGCILVHGCLAAATDGWWSLNPIERKLLVITVNTDSICTTRDIPVFLPYKSPNIAFRLVSVTLINHVEVLALCGPTPDLPEIERYVIQCWKNSIDILHNIEQCYTQNLSLSITLDSEILGLLLANCSIKKYALVRNVHGAKNRATGSHKLDILKTFYHQVVETFILSSESQDPSNTDWKFEGAKETYLCSEYHKCYAVREGDHILCVLYASSIPTHTARLITQRLLRMLCVEKHGWA